MNKNIIALANHLHNAQPLLRSRKINFEREIYDLSKDDKIDFLVYYFKNYDKGYNQSLVLNCTCLWEEFNTTEWTFLIKKMFPRQNFDSHSLKDINSGWYCDILLINGIIGINPFEYIFNDLTITFEEKKLFFNFLKFRGKYTFYINERELIEDIVTFYELEVFQKIVTMKDKLIQEGFTPSIKYEEIIDQYSFFDT